MWICDRTLDRVMDLGEHLPKFTILVEVVDAVPMRVIGSSARQRRCRCRPDGKYDRLGGGHHLGFSVKERVQVGELKLEGGRGWLDLGSPCGEGIHGLLQGRDSGVVLLLCHADVVTALAVGHPPLMSAISSLTLAISVRSCLDISSRKNLTLGSMALNSCFWRCV
jgi:hypothetical protein